MARDYFPAGKKSADEVSPRSLGHAGGAGRRGREEAENAARRRRQRVRVARWSRDFNGRKILEVRRNKLERA